MRNVEDIVILFFKHISPGNVLDGTLSYNKVSREEFERLASAYLLHYSGSEREALYEHFLSLFESREQLYGGKSHGNRNLSWNVFHPVFLFAETVLLEKCSDIMCSYQSLLDWRRVTREVSEELFVTAFCAVRDVRRARERGRFDWKLVIGNNNTYLNKILSQGLAENHFHLWASAPVFQLSWVRLMNDIENAGFVKMFEDMDENRRKRNIKYGFSYGEELFAVQHLQAVIIRLYLYSWLTDRRIRLAEYRVKADEVFSYVRADLRDMMCSWKPQKHIEQKRELEEAWTDTADRWKMQGTRKVKNYWIVLMLIRNIPGDAWKDSFGNRDREQHTLWDMLALILKDQKEVLLEWVYPLLDERMGKVLWQRCTEEAVDHMLHDSRMLCSSAGVIQNVIEGFRRPEASLGAVWDYMLDQVRERDWRQEDAVWYLNGERWFLYQMFRRMCMGQEGGRLYNWFYAYLVIQGNIRGEMAQINSEIGLYNFIRYERRKGGFLDQEDWKCAIVRMAVASTLKSSHIRQLEARISPCDTARENMEYIQNLDRTIDPECRLRSRYYYVMHFIKEPEQITEEDMPWECRSLKLRNKIQEQALALALFRENYPVKAARLRGIDAASQEIGCRPEVFSQAFRFLREHTVELNPEEEENIGLRMLGITYHVGEDFMDLADGLRAIHEAIRFLNMDCGDRLGHALALGVDADQWYEKKRHRILISQQDYLDNLAWLHGRITRFHIPELGVFLHYLEGEFERYFKIVYGRFIGQQHTCTINTYYSAWKLRSDNPYCYRNGRFEPEKTQGTGFESYAVNLHCPRARGLRDIPDVAFLYHTYHFNREVKLEGSKKIEIKVPDIWVKGVKRVQREMQQLVAESGLSIETNPSSNCNIGTFQKYEKHPIVNWYNAHLTMDQEALQSCSQISVSINTDDQGIFGTCLENEYALMACALEMERDKDGNKVYMRNMVYEWLDHVRKMGLRQSFGLEREREAALPLSPKF